MPAFTRQYTFKKTSSCEKCSLNKLLNLNLLLQLVIFMTSQSKNLLEISSSEVFYYLQLKL